MIPIVTPAEMALIDSTAPEPVEVLIGRAGAAVVRSALDLLGGAYGRRVAVIAGKGNNGNDGREAARRLRRRGVRVEVLDALAPPTTLAPTDLVIDAAYGTGFRGEWFAPRVGRAPVLAVDIPSGLDGTTGEASGLPLRATRTVTFAALKPGLLLADGLRLAGQIEVADIGLDCSRARAHMVEAADAGEWWPVRPLDSHKWRSAVWIVAGSAGMSGAAQLAARGASRAGAGYVRLSSPGATDHEHSPLEVVGHLLPADGWAAEVVGSAERMAAVAVGPGLGRRSGVAEEVRQLAATLAKPLVIDGDGLAALGRDVCDVLAGRSAPTVLTPHDGEYAQLTGASPAADRFAAARQLAERSGAVVLLKGPTTIVANPAGDALAVSAGDQRLATAGTGDVLTGVVAALLAAGVDPFRAAGAAAYVHGAAARRGPRVGLTAPDLLDLLPEAIGATLDASSARSLELRRRSPKTPRGGSQL